MLIQNESACIKSLFSMINFIETYLNKILWKLNYHFKNWLAKQILQVSYAFYSLRLVHGHSRIIADQPRIICVQSQIIRGPLRIIRGSSRIIHRQLQIILVLSLIIPDHSQIISGSFTDLCGRSRMVRERPRTSANVRKVYAKVREWSASDSQRSAFTDWS